MCHLFIDVLMLWKVKMATTESIKGCIHKVVKGKDANNRDHKRVHSQIMLVAKILAMLPHMTLQK